MENSDKQKLFCTDRVRYSTILFPVFITYAVDFASAKSYHYEAMDIIEGSGKMMIC